MDVDADYASTDIRYRDRICVDNKDTAVLVDNGAKRKVGAIKSANKVQASKAKCGESVKVESVKGAGCLGNSVEVPILEDGATASGGAGCLGDSVEVPRVEDGATASGGANVECSSSEVEKGERRKGSVDATPADEDSVSVKCQVKQMSKEKIRRIGQHLSGSKGKCSVVLLCWINIVV